MYYLILVCEGVLVQVQLTQFALKKLDMVVDEFWAEISDSIQTIEVVYEDKMYPQEVRRQYYCFRFSIIQLLMVT